MLVPAPEGFEGAYRFEALDRLRPSMDPQHGGEWQCIVNDADGPMSRVAQG